MVHTGYQASYTNYGVPVLAVVPMVQARELLPEWCFIARKIDEAANGKEHPIHRWERGGYAWQHQASYLLGTDVKNRPGQKSQAKRKRKRPRTRPFFWLIGWEQIKRTWRVLQGKPEIERRFQRYVPQRKPTNSHFLLDNLHPPFPHAEGRRFDDV